MTYKPLTELTPKQQAFVDRYLALNDASKACLAAGYATDNPRNMGYQLLHNSKIKAAIALGRAQIAERTTIDQDTLVAKLFGVANDLNEPGAVRVSAIVHLGKWLGYYVDKKEISIDQHVTHQALPPGLTFDELVALSHLGDEEQPALSEPEAETIDGDYYESIDDGEGD